MTLKDFPRGGKKPFSKSPGNFLFAKKEKVKQRKNRVKNVEATVETTQEENFVAKTAQCLSYTTLSVGMVVLGRVHFSSEYDLRISLPGRLSGVVQLTDISESYTNLLQNLVGGEKNQLTDFKQLSDIFKKDDYVVCYVKTMDSQQKNRVVLSIEPELINQNLDPSKLDKGSKIACSISSVEDHGYVVDTGLKNLRGFLASKDVPEGVEYSTGQQVFCAVKSINSAENTWTAKLSTKVRHTNTAVTFDGQSLDALVPGTRFVLTVKNILSNGLQVAFNDNSTGYINQIYLESPLTSYDQGADIIGTLMYVMPTVKFAYFTQLCSDKETTIINSGEIIKSAKFLYKESNGIVLSLKKGVKGFVPFKRTNVDFNKISSVFVRESIHKCRILSYDRMDQLYICTMEKDQLNKNISTPESLKFGDIVEVTIMNYKENGFCFVKHEHILGDVPPEHVMDIDQDPKTKPIVSQKVKARLLGKNENGTRFSFTLKKSLVESKLPILTNLNDAKKGDEYQGTIVYKCEQGFLVRFFGEVAGFMPINVLRRLNKTIDEFKIGQVVDVIINMKKEGGRMLLDMIDKDNEKKKMIDVQKHPQNVSFKIGKNVKGTIVDASPEGVHLKIAINNGKNFVIGSIPAKYMAPCIEVGSYISARCIPGDTLSAFVLSKFPKFILTTSLSDVKFDVNEEDSGKIMAIDTLTTYFSKLREISNSDYYKNKPIASIRLGQRISGVVEKVTEHGLVLKLENDIVGTVRTAHFEKNFKAGDKVNGTVLWINYIHELVEVTLMKKLAYSIKPINCRLPRNSLEVQLQGEIVLLTNWFALVLLKGHGNGHLAAMPIRTHAKDNPNFSNYSIGRKIRCYVVLDSYEAVILPICLVKSEFEDRKIHLEKVQGMKRKIEADPEVKEAIPKKLKKKTKVDEKEHIKLEEVNNVIVEDIVEPELKISKRKCTKNIEEKKDMKIETKSKNIKKEKMTVENKKTEEIENMSIPECGFFWDTKPSSDLQKENEDSSSSDDDETNAEPKQKKKKLSAAERREDERKKEREIRDREEALARNETPNSVDEFDRLVLASPDSSLIWVQYMAYHLQATEIEKARSVAKRALKTINFREEDEKLNVWKAWLNLESRFGSPETLNNTFEEAVKANDSKKIYLAMLAVHGDAGRHVELEKTVKTVTGKYKEDPQVWVDCGRTFLASGLKEKSRHTMQRALQSLPDREHVNLMVKFAQLENKLGDKERAQTLFEQILSSYPKRVDIWSLYVDSLIKAADIESARTVLNRAVVQTLPPRKMKTLFQKFVSFEEKHGTEESLNNAKQIAVQYVTNQCRKPA